MRLQVTVLDRSGKWREELKGVLDGFAGLELEFTRDGAEPGQLVFVDAGLPELEARLGALDRRGRAFFLVQPEQASMPSALERGIVDDVLVRPFRPMEVLGKLRLYQRLMMWSEVSSLSQSFSELVARFREDVKLVERLQKAKLPAVYPNLKGIKVSTRYVAGLQAGGDHFDLADATKASQVSLMLTDCSSYGLSSALLAILMRVALKLSVEGSASVSDTVARIRQELAIALGEKDSLSIFFGTLSRKDMTLRYLNLGSGMAFHARRDSDFKRLAGAGPALRSTTESLSAEHEKSVTLGPEDRLVLLSDGFLKPFGSEKALLDCLDEFRAREPVDLLNELMFRVKSKLADPDDLPEQDCTGIVLDVDGNVLRLAKS